MVRVDVDSSVEVSWRAFEHRLTAELVELAPGQTLRVEVPTGRGGRSPIALSFRGRPKTILANAIGSPPVRGAGSRPRRRPPEGVPALKMFRVGAEPAIATWTVSVLREAYGVIHPAFLRPTRHEPSGEPVRAGAGTTGTTGGTAAGSTASAGGGLVMPTSPEQLDDLVERALSVGVASLPLVRDEDGDIPLTGEHGTVYVRVRRDRPLVEVFAMLTRLDGDADLDAVAADINRRNVSSLDAIFFLVNGFVLVRVSVWSRPFVPATLLRAVNRIMQVLDDAATGVDEDDDVEEDDADDDSVGTEVDPGDGDAGAADDDPAPDALAPELLTIIQLDVADPGSVSPELAARIYGYDRDLLLSGIRESEVQMIAWRNSVDEARERDEEEARVCAGESASWQSTTDLLRAALRVTVER